MLRVSAANFGCLESKCFKAGESAGCLRNPSRVRPSSCHLQSVALFDDMNSRCSLLLIGKYRRTFLGTLCTCLPSGFFFTDFQREVLHIGQLSASLLFFQN